MGKSVTKDMTQGSPLKLILQFFLPLLLGMLFQQFYTLMDTIIVGKFLGVKALAAVGATGSINFMIIGFCMGICNGFAIPVAQQFGAKNYTYLRKYVANSVWLAIAFAAVLTIAVCILCRNILVWMNTPSDIIDKSYEFIFIIFLGIPMTYLYNLLSGIIRSLGDSKAPLVFLVISSLINVALDCFTILVLHLGVRGAGISTVTAQGISGLLCYLYIKKKFDILKISKEEWKMDPYCMKQLCIVGVPMGLQYSITAIGSVILQTSVNTLGSMYVAAVTAGSRISMFFCCPFDAFGSTMATYAGQNVGAGKINRVSKGMKSCCMLGFLYSIVACMVLVSFGGQIALLFVNRSDTEVLHNVRLFLMANSLFYFPLALVNIIRFTIQGLGYSSLAILSGVSEMIARILVAVVFVSHYGYIAACFASPVAWVFADIFLIPAFLFVTSRLRKKFKKGMPLVL